MKSTFRRFLRDILIFVRYRVKLREESYSNGDIFISYSLQSRLGNDKTIAFALASVKKHWAGLRKRFWIDELQVKRDRDKGKGLGSYLIRFIIRDAKRFNLPITLVAKPGGVGGVRFDTEELENWYARYGFVREGGVMVRKD